MESNDTLKIAIVDDEVPILQMLENYFSRNEKYEVTSFSNPLEMLSSLKSNTYHVVLLDIMMPQLDGIETLREIKLAHEPTKVIMMTAYSSLDKVLSSHKNGAHSYILKPFSSLASVEKKILEVLKQP